MKIKKPLLTAVMLSGAVALGSQPLLAQETQRRMENPAWGDSQKPATHQPSVTPSPSQGEWNMSAQNVRKIQEALRDKGYNPGPVDGIMGDRTEEALRNFQQANNLPATGLMDSKTAEKLGVGLTGQAGSIQQQERRQSQQ